MTHDSGNPEGPQRHRGRPARPGFGDLDHEYVTAIPPLKLRCEDAPNPMGVETSRPQLSWIFEVTGHDRKQSAYQIIVASTPERLARDQADLWDSGQVDSSQSVHVAYGGVPLASRQRCHWKVRVWDSESVPSDWSAPATWEMGLLHPEDWQATWIGSGPAREPRPAHGFFRSTAETNQPVVVDSRSTLLRKSFVTRMPVREARVYVSGLGYYELQLNGPRVRRPGPRPGEDQLPPVGFV